MVFREVVEVLGNLFFLDVEEESGVDLFQLLALGIVHDSVEAGGILHTP